MRDNTRLRRVGFIGALVALVAGAAIVQALHAPSVLAVPALAAVVG